jgi:hypothetical protein
MSNDPGTGFWRSKFGLVCAGFLAIAAFFLITEHTAHVLGALPWLLFAACPLMHLFMHHGHGSHDHGGHADTTRSDPDQAQGERR